MALTATATDNVIRDVMSILGMKKDAFLWISQSDPGNLAMEAQPKDNGTTKTIYSFILKQGRVPGLIFCLLRADCERMSSKYLCGIM
jgi:superfamily II DNA helicase RecQ